MKTLINRLGTYLLIGACGIHAYAEEAADTADSSNGAKIEFATPEYDFGKISSGELVKYTFVFTNTGNATLEITGVQPSCGCTTAGEWSKKVEPGETGSIPVQFNSGNFGGNVSKHVTVTSNAKNTPSMMLQIKGTIWKPIDVTPGYAVLSVNSESVSNATATVKIVNNTEEPLTLEAPVVGGKQFTAELKTVTEGKVYEVAVRSVPPLDPMNTQAIVTLKTSSTNVPTVSFTAMTIVQPSVATTPNLLNVPSGPLDEAFTTTVTIRNQLQEPLKLTEPTLNNDQIKFKMVESEPGKTYNVNFSFPVGFQLAPDANSVFSVKTSHSQNPVINIPIRLTPTHAMGTPSGVAVSPRAQAVVNQKNDGHAH